MDEDVYNLIFNVSKRLVNGELHQDLAHDVVIGLLQDTRFIGLDVENQKKYAIFVLYFTNFKKRNINKYKIIDQINTLPEIIDYSTNEELDINDRLDECLSVLSDFDKRVLIELKNRNMKLKILSRDSGIHFYALKDKITKIYQKINDRIEY